MKRKKITRFRKHPLRDKIVLLLYAGVVLGLSSSTRQHIRIYRELPKAWKEINRTALKRHLYGLQHDGIITRAKEGMRTMKLVLTPTGKEYATSMEAFYRRPHIPTRWDKKWRIVLFDIPEEQRDSRDDFRRYLKSAGFKEYQQSAWIFPYDCYNEIDAVVKMLRIRDCVSIAVVEHITREFTLRKTFNL